MHAWPFEALAVGKHQQTRHDGSHWGKDVGRSSLAGTELGFKVALGAGGMRSRGTISKFRISLGRLESSPLPLLLGTGRRVTQSTLFEQLGKRAPKDTGRLDARLRTVRNFDHRNRRDLLKTPRSFEA